MKNLTKKLSLLAIALVATSTIMQARGSRLPSFVDRATKGLLTGRQKAAQRQDRAFFALLQQKDNFSLGGADQVNVPNPIAGLEGLFDLIAMKKAGIGTVSSSESNVLPQKGFQPVFAGFSKFFNEHATQRNLAIAAGVVAVATVAGVVYYYVYSLPAAASALALKATTPSEVSTVATTAATAAVSTAPAAAQASGLEAPATAQASAETAANNPADAPVSELGIPAGDEVSTVATTAATAAAQAPQASPETAANTPAVAATDASAAEAQVAPKVPSTMLGNLFSQVIGAYNAAKSMIPAMPTVAVPTLADLQAKQDALAFGATVVGATCAAKVLQAGHVSAAATKNVVDGICQECLYQPEYCTCPK